jgi:hypothetical protein
MPSKPYLSSKEATAAAAVAAVSLEEDTSNTVPLT